MVKLLSLFSGIGAFEKALTNLGIPFELIAYCEFDKYASKAYSVIHDVPESMNLGDITKVDEKTLPVNVVDILTYGFPCQPFSVAGRQEGFDDSKGRGNLFFDALRIIQHCKPKIAIAENVKNLAGKKFEKEFQTVLQSLEDAGYNNYWKILDAKDYDLAQHRERVICVSIRKDLDTGVFEFPKPVKLVKCLYDYLEKEVDEILVNLGMKGTTFGVSIKEKSGTEVEQKCGPYGKDDVEFLISANPGNPLLPLAKIASGGELSRVMLALKTIFAKSDSVGTLIFDEIDTGIGGEIAVSVGNHIKKLATGRQIFCITHLASIAVYADNQVKIEKSVTGGVTASNVHAVEGEDRVLEIARMLSGDSDSSESIEHARKLLNKYSGGF